MKGDEVHAENENPDVCGFDDVMDDDVVDEIMGSFDENEIWLGSTDHEQYENNLNDSSIFCGKDFPPIPHDFPCMSSTSSSSSTPAAAAAAAAALTNNDNNKQHFVSSSASPASSASSAASWAIIRSDVVEPPKQQQDVSRSNTIKYDAAVGALSYTDGCCFYANSDATVGMAEDVDCMNVMEDLGYMDLIEDSNDLWDPSSIFQSDDDDDDDDDMTNTISTDPNQGIISNQLEQQKNQEDGYCYIIEGKKEVTHQEKTAANFDELGVMFFEWLKNNKEHISVEDMRNIKFKKSTIECASKRLGSTKEGRKQLLKLILDWVEKYLLQKKATRDQATAAAVATPPFHQVPCSQYQEPFRNPNPNSNFMMMNSSTTDPNAACLWIPTPATCFDQATVVPAASTPVAFPPPAVAQFRPFVNGAIAAPMNICQPYPPHMRQTDYQMIESSQSWPQPQFVLAPRYNSFPKQNGYSVAPFASHSFAPAGNGVHYHSQVYNGINGERIVKLAPSATKEARKKRMARQRRGSHRHHSNQNQLHYNIDSPEQSEGQFGFENCSNNIDGQTNSANWLYWPAAIEAPILAQPQQLECHLGDQTSPQAQSNQPQVQSELGQPQKQGLRSEKNLKFLLQKVLKQSDVGNLGRIVLPKKEAEAHLPQLETRDGISIAMEDIGTSKVWNLRYRFWPNNKSRMYLLENTGEFVKANGLQEGDFIVIYSDIKCGKYLIRGVRVRPPAGVKFQGKAKATRRNHRNTGAGNGHSSAPFKSNGVA